MELAKKIQKKLKASDYGMAQKMQLRDVTAWQRLKESKAGYLKPLYRLFEISELTADEFVQLFKK